MTEKFYTILTNVGKASIANATALGGKVDFKYMALGDGNGNYYNPTETQTELKNEVYRTQINHVQLDEENLNWVTLTIVIPTSVGGFTVREVGAFDTEGNLLVIGKYPETYKPKLDEGSGKDLTVNMILEVSNSSVVNLKIDPTVILATKKDIDVLSNRITKNETDITELKEGSTVIEELETENKTLAGAINEVKTDLDAHKADYEYQIPVINSTQIQLSKQSDTNRLFFKLEESINGNITISLDKGVTEKPLKDIEGNQISSLDKGFVEVVAYANFFILRNRGISSNDLQALIEITNNAEINEHVIKTNIINALNDKAGSGLIHSSSWIDVQNAISGMNNKKWASGTGTVGSNGIAVVNNLGFSPSTVIINAGQNKGYSILLLYDKNLSPYFSGTDTAGIMTQTDIQGAISATGVTRKGISVLENSFSGDTEGFANSKPFKWFAIE